MSINGPVESLRIRPIPRLLPGTSETLEIGIKVKDAGKVPVEVEISFVGEHDGRKATTTKPLWIGPSGGTAR